MGAESRRTVARSTRTGPRAVYGPSLRRFSGWLIGCLIALTYCAVLYGNGFCASDIMTAVTRRPIGVILVVAYMCAMTLALYLSQFTWFTVTHEGLRVRTGWHQLTGGSRYFAYSDLLSVHVRRRPLSSRRVLILVPRVGREINLLLIWLAKEREFIDALIVALPAHLADGLQKSLPDAYVSLPKHAHQHDRPGRVARVRV